ncbi:MAG: immunogenic protein [Oscillospiraceae bacterium]|nr:immunogenic protein [Oscillospiraceae bacterium]
MKKILLLLLCVLLLIPIAGCAEKPAVKDTVEGNMRTYYEMTDGTWMCDGHTYQYRLEIGGRMPNAAKDSVFTYLSNIEEISFQQAYMAAGVSSSSEDYFLPEEAVLVDMN